MQSGEKPSLLALKDKGRFESEPIVQLDPPQTYSRAQAHMLAECTGEYRKYALGGQGRACATKASAANTTITSFAMTASASYHCRKDNPGQGHRGNANPWLRLRSTARVVVRTRARGTAVQRGDLDVEGVADVLLSCFQKREEFPSPGRRREVEKRATVRLKSSKKI